MKVGQSFLLAGLILFFIAAGTAVWLIHGRSHTQALQEAEAKAALLLERNLATHTYFTHQLKPSVFKLVEGLVPDEYFDPAWMSSTFAVREIDKYYKQISDSNYYYKECAINARYPENEASGYEADFLRRAGSDPNLQMEAGIRTIEGQTFYVVLRRGEAMEESCLRCHSTPEQAPGELVDKYGPDRSFNRQSGELVSAVSIRIPVSQAYANANRFALQLSLILVLILTILCLVFFALNRKLFVAPLNALRNRANDLAGNPEALGTEIPADFTGEWNDLAIALNTMSLQLHQDQEALEARIGERTAELLDVNERLSREIAGHKRTVLALENSEKRFRTLYEKAPIGYQSLDYDGNIIEVNETWLEMMGYTRDEVIGRNFGDFLHPEYKEHFQENFPVFKSVGEIIGVVFQVCKKDGDSVTISLNGRIARDDEGRFIQTHCAIHNITEQVKAEEEKRRLENQLRQSQKMEALGTLSGGIAHDFNNILAAIIGYSEMAVINGEEGSPNRNELEQVLKAAHRAKNLVKQILTFSRKAETESKPVDINREVKRSIDIIQSTLPRMIKIRLDLADELSLVKGDPNQLGQVLLNLAANARDAMPDGGVLSISTRNIHVAGKQCTACGDLFSGFFVEISVADTGKGISENDLKKIFDPFFTTKEVGKGTGLGLSMVFGILKSHGGHVVCTSHPEQGALFEVYLPVISGERPHDRKKDSSLDLSLFQGQGVILLVDDEEALRDLGQDILTRFGYRVLLAGTGEEALHICRREKGRINLVILDVNMPGMGGQKCLAELLTIAPGIKVLIASGYAKDTHSSDFIALGALGYLSKPFTLEEMIATVHAHI